MKPASDMHNGCHLFGVRHLSPGCSGHLLAFLDAKKPHVVLIEGPADAAEVLRGLAAKGVRPPVAMLAYTLELPIETVLYPFADYSPEYQAILWAARNGAEARFIDLPSDIMLKLRQAAKDEGQAEREGSFHCFHNSLYEKLAGSFHEDDYESYWERNFEHCLEPGGLQDRLALQACELRALVVDRERSDAPYDHSYNLVREAHMRREIMRVIESGVSPDEIAVVCGAYHTAGLSAELAPMSDADLQSIPRVDSRITLMPYSYLRLSSRTGYGAGNMAPRYFEMMWRCMRANKMRELPAVYLSSIARDLRNKGHGASTAGVIEAVRLAVAMAALRSGGSPVLKDLHDAAVTCFGGGSLALVAESLNMADIGTAIGSLPEGVSQTPVQEDLNLELKRLKLVQYKSSVAQELSLDLREKLRVKSGEAAFIDLNRSTFLHRLEVLGIHFARQVPVTQDSATWAEKWMLQWTPEAEIEIVEANLKGETLEIAAAYELREQLADCAGISLAARVIRQACECGLARIFDSALNVLQTLLVESPSFKETATAARELSLLIKYGDIRRFNLDPLTPVLQRIFLRASLLLVGAASCDDKAAGEITQVMNLMELVSQEQYGVVDTETWQNELQKAAERDNLNTRISGAAFALLLEHNLAGDADCAKEVSRRLSPGIPADLGAGWFEGLSGRNRYALISRVSLWKELDAYVQSLDEDGFMRAVVFLRRAFGQFEPAQKNSVAELLGGLWGSGAEAAAELLRAELTEPETKKLEELKDFDFDF